MYTHMQSYYLFYMHSHAGTLSKVQRIARVIKYIANYGCEHSHKSSTIVCRGRGKNQIVSMECMFPGYSGKRSGE